MPMRLTREADYAVRVVLDLAEHARDGPVRSRDVARRQRVPHPFLRKVVQALTRAGHVRTRRGTGGGIALARSPHSLTVRTVIEAVDGPIALNRCVIAPGTCPLDRTCPAHPLWRRIQDLVTQELDRATIESLRQCKRAETHP
jgi:Rrf2 family protein